MRVFTEERKKNISEACKWRIPWNKWKEWSQEVKDKISQWNEWKTLWRKRPEHSKLLKDRWFAPMEWKKHSNESLIKMSLAHKWKKQSEEWARKRWKAISWEKHRNWKWWPKTTKAEKHRIRNSFEYKNRRKAVFERDNYICIDCSTKWLYIEAHHIKSFSDYPELRFDINNWSTLCKKCHNKYTFSNKKETCE